MSEEYQICGNFQRQSDPGARKWGKSHVRWAWRGLHPTLSNDHARQAVAAAFAMWEEVLYKALTFEEAVSGQDADIILTTGRIDRQGSVLAWSEFPAGLRRVQQMYDTADRFVIAISPQWPQVGMHEVAAHEIGHALGLDHDDEGSGALLAPTYKPGLWRATARDAERIRRLYPAPDPDDEKKEVDRLVIRAFSGLILTSEYECTKVRRVV